MFVLVPQPKKGPTTSPCLHGQDPFKFQVWCLKNWPTQGSDLFFVLPNCWWYTVNQCKSWTSPELNFNIGNLKIGLYKRPQKGSKRIVFLPTIIFQQTLRFGEVILHTSQVLDVPTEDAGCWCGFLVTTIGWRGIRIHLLGSGKSHCQSQPFFPRIIIIRGFLLGIQSNSNSPPQKFQALFHPSLFPGFVGLKIQKIQLPWGFSKESQNDPRLYLGNTSSESLATSPQVRKFWGVWMAMWVGGEDHDFLVVEPPNWSNLDNFPK